MKKIFYSLVTVLGLSSPKSNATTTELQFMDHLKEEQLVLILDYLIQKGIVVQSEPNQLKINQTVLDQLRKSGLIKVNPHAAVDSICVVPEPK